MGWEKWQQKIKNQTKEIFHIFTITLLSLLLPLSFLLLARLSKTHSLSSNPFPDPLSLLFSLFLYTNPSLIHALVFIITISTLIHCLTGKSHSPEKNSGPKLHVAWIFLSTLQICVGLGIEGRIAIGVDGVVIGSEKSLLCRVVFFLGMYETTLYWCRMVVKPVVDDTVFGGVREERWVEKAVMAASFCGLWWWRLRDEAEIAVVGGGDEAEDFVEGLLFYVTLGVGVVRVVKGVVWLVVVLCFRRFRVREVGVGGLIGNDAKV